MTPRPEAAQPLAPAWPLLYEPEIRAIGDRLKQELLTTVLRGARGTGKTTVLRELNRLHGGEFVQGRDPGTAGDLLDRARREKSNLFVDDLDYLLDPERERTTGDPADLEHKARRAIEYLRQHQRAIVVSFMYPDRRFDDEYSGTISNLWSIGEREYLPHPGSPAWQERLRKLLQEPGRDLWAQRPEGNYCVMVSGTRVPLTNRIEDIWCNEILAQTGGHPTLLSATMRALVKEAEDDSSPTATNKVPLSQLRARARDWLELLLAGEALNPLRLRLAALRKSDRDAFELLVRAAQAGGTVSLSPQTARSHRAVLEHDGLAYYDGRKGCLTVLGQGLQTEVVQVFGAGAPLVPDANEPDQRGLLRLTTAEGNRSLLLTGQPWQVLKLLYERGGTPVTSAEIKDHVNAATPGAVRAIVQRLSRRLADVGMTGAIENSRRTGYYLVMSKFNR